MKKTKTAHKRYAKIPLQRSESLGQQLIDISRNEALTDALESYIPILCKVTDQEQAFVRTMEWLQHNPVSISVEEVWKLINQSSKNNLEK